jgi:hypothetical protein
MSPVDRWLARALADRGAATSATSATSPKKASITAALEVASRVRLPATSAQATTGSPDVSQPVADTLRREKPQNSPAINDMSQLSQMSQVVMTASDEDEPAAIVEHDGGSPREVECTPSQPTLLAPGLWFDRFRSTRRTGLRRTLRSPSRPSGASRQVVPPFLRYLRCLGGVRIWRPRRSSRTLVLRPAPPEGRNVITPGSAVTQSVASSQPLRPHRSHSLVDRSRRRASS